MDDTTLSGQTWVAFGPTGAIGSVHRTGERFAFKLVGDEEFRGSFDSVDAAKSALHSASGSTERPEFREH